MTTFTSFSSLCIGMVCLVSIESNAQWLQTNGPYGGNVQCIAFSGTNLVVGTPDDGVFLSTNSGTSWSPANNGLPNTQVVAFAVLDSTLFAGTQGFGIYRSMNHGTTWSEANDEVTAVGLSRSYVCTFAVHANNIYAGTNGGGVYFSADSGSSWRAINTGLPNDGVVGISFIGNNLFVGTTGDGVFRSTDNGTSWGRVNVGLTDSVVECLAARGTTLFAGTDMGGGLFCSTDSGSTWRPAVSGLPYSDVDKYTRRYWGPDAFVIDSSQETGAKVLALCGTVLQLSDDGTKWISIDTNHILSGVRTLTTSGGSWFAGTTSAGVFRSTDYGKSWDGASNGLRKADVLCLLNNGKNLLAGTAGAGVFLSTNSGTTWEGISAGLSGSYVYDLAMYDTILFAATDGSGVFRSMNNGKRWTSVNTGAIDTRVFALWISGDNLLAGTNSGVYLSHIDNSSMTWYHTDVPNVEVWDFADIGPYLFSATMGNGVFRSTNNGINWESASAGLPAPKVFSLTAVETTLFVGTDGYGIFHSTDHGTSWMSPGIGYTGKYVYDFAVSGPNIFAASNAGVDRVTNSGTTIDTHFPPSFAYALAAGDTDLFAGTWKGGVWRRSLSELITLTSIATATGPLRFALGQNYPNPFNPSTVISYQLHTNAAVVLKVFDLLGREVKTLVNERQNAGNHSITFNATNLPSGVYFYRLEAGMYHDTKRLLIIK